MIYISSASTRIRNICQSVDFLASHGFKNIELSGGEYCTQQTLNVLIDLQKKYQLNYLCHNYFPPPEIPFVLNLASFNDEVLQKSRSQVLTALDWSEKLNGPKYGIHAGFQINIKPDEIGLELSKTEVKSRKDCLSRMQDSYQKVNSSKFTKMYIENNVLSERNFHNYKMNPFLFTCFDEYLEMKEYFDFNPLIDIAHLKVSCQSLNLNFEEQLSKLLPLTDYIHLSDNNGIADLNWGLKENSQLVNQLRSYDLKNKVITLECYVDLDEIKESYRITENLIK